jgi:hypothetical protein
MSNSGQPAPCPTLLFQPSYTQALADILKARALGHNRADKAPSGAGLTSEA